MADETPKAGFLGNITEWLAHPFNTQGSAFRWVLFVGLLIIATFLWQLVLIEITREV